MEQNYRVSCKIGESSFEIESTDLKWLESKEKEYFEKLFGKVPRHMERTPREITEARALPPQIALVEFYRKYVHGTKSRPTIALFFVYHLQKIQKKDSITTADVASCFKDISYPKWNELNVADILSNSRRRGLLNYVNSLWSLTTTGEDYVLNNLSGKSE